MAPKKLHALVKTTKLENKKTLVQYTDDWGQTSTTLLN